MDPIVLTPEQWEELEELTQEERDALASLTPEEADALAELNPDDPRAARRIALTISCSDCDVLPKVENAGQTYIRQNGTAVQVMHNGLLIREGCYYGDLTTIIIRELRGHHEPQEELVFARVLDRLSDSEPNLPMIELGSFWAYYGLWYRDRFPDAKVVALEPDPVWLQVGRDNAELNNLTVSFVRAAVGDSPGELLDFLVESSKEVVPVVQHDLDSLLADQHLDRVGLLLADVQGHETVLLERASETLASGRVRFLIVSTHHHSISGDALTHQRCRDLLLSAGAHIIAEHTVGESFSGDGLIAVSFDPQDRDFEVPISHARYRDSHFGELEYDLANALERIRELEAQPAQPPDGSTGKRSRVRRTTSALKARLGSGVR